MACAVLCCPQAKTEKVAELFCQVMRVHDQHKDLSALELDIHLIAQLAASKRLSRDLFVFTILRMQDQRPTHPLTLAAVSQVRVMQDKLDPENKDPM